MDDAPSPKKRWELTKEDFDRLLAWLDDDRDKAAIRYEEIRVTLIRNFRRLRSMSPPEDLTDRTLNRVAQKLPEVAPTYVGAREPYFYAVAFNIYREDLRTPETVPLPEGGLPAPANPQDELESSDTPEAVCLRLSIPQLKERDRVVVVNYYRGDKGEKIRLRNELCRLLKLKPEDLRRIAHRARKKLKKLIKTCLRKKYPRHVVTSAN